MIKFNYTKANGETTARIGAVLSSPQNMYGILDLSELNEAELTEISLVLKEYTLRKAELLQALDAEFNMHELRASYFKKFKPEGIEVVK